MNLMSVKLNTLKSLKQINQNIYNKILKLFRLLNKGLSFENLDAYLLLPYLCFMAEIKFFP